MTETAIQPHFKTRDIKASAIELARKVTVPTFDNEALIATNKQTAQHDGQGSSWTAAQIIDALAAQGILAFCDQTGGNTATIMVGVVNVWTPPGDDEPVEYYEATIGPGYFNWDDAGASIFDTEELSVGPDQSGPFTDEQVGFTTPDLYMLICATLEVVCGGFKVGDRVRSRRATDLYPHYAIDAGVTGVVVESTEEWLRVRLDKRVVTLDEWDNEIHYNIDAESRMYAGADWEKTGAIVPEVIQAEAILSLARVNTRKTALLRASNPWWPSEKVFRVRVGEVELVDGFIRYTVRPADPEQKADFKLAFDNEYETKAYESQLEFVNESA